MGLEMITLNPKLNLTLKQKINFLRKNDDNSDLEHGPGQPSKVREKRLRNRWQKFKLRNHNCEVSFDVTSIN